jgi:hypothetical protein
VLIGMTHGSDADTTTGEGEALRERRRILLEEVRRLERAERFAAALQAIRDSGLTSTDRADLQPEIARLKQAVRLQESYQRAREALEAGEGDAALRLAAVVAVEPQYKDAAKLLYEAVSGASVDGLEAEVRASRDAASRIEAERDHLGRGRARLAWVAGVQGVVLSLLVGWMVWRSPRTGAPARTAPPPASAAARVARPAPSASSTALSPVPEEATTQSVPAPEAVAQGNARSEPSARGSAAPVASSEGPPPEPEGPCARIGESCSSTGQCCSGSACYGTTCQDSRRTIVFGKYRP